MGLLRGMLGGILLALGLIFSLPAQAEAPETEIKVEQAFDAKAYAESLVMAYDWNPTDATCLMKLWGKESSWNHLADNPTSSAFGIAQLLGETSKDPARQIRQGLKYIAHRYGTPCKGWEFWQKFNYY